MQFQTLIRNTVLDLSCGTPRPAETNTSTCTELYYTHTHTHTRHFSIDRKQALNPTSSEMQKVLRTIKLTFQMLSVDLLVSDECQHIEITK